MNTLIRLQERRKTHLYVFNRLMAETAGGAKRPGGNDFGMAWERNDPEPYEKILNL